MFRLRVFDGIVSEDRVLVQEFVERSVFVFEEDRWWYQGGDPDWEPKSITTGGPLNNLGGGGGGGGGDRVSDVPIDAFVEMEDKMDK